MPAKALTVGAAAPDFALKNQDDEVVKLAGLRGRWVVLYFYPKDDTPGCTTEACEFTAGIKDFEGLNATVLGCSPDAPERHRKFIAKWDLKIGLLSDPTHQAIGDFGAWGEKNMYGRITEGVLRSTVIIDPEGRIAHHFPKVTAKGHAEKVKEILGELQAEATKAKRAKA
jgi:peroxiredoxin Q/BCP